MDISIIYLVIASPFLLYLAFIVFKYKIRCFVIVSVGIVPILIVALSIGLTNKFIHNLSLTEQKSIMNILYPKCQSEKFECMLFKDVNGWRMRVDSQYPMETGSGAYINKMRALRIMFNIRVNKIQFNNKVVTIAKDYE